MDFLKIIEVVISLKGNWPSNHTENMVIVSQTSNNSVELRNIKNIGDDSYICTYETFRSISNLINPLISKIDILKQLNDLRGQHIKELTNVIEDYTKSQHNLLNVLKDKK